MIDIDNILIATYMNPDLDGFACAFALNELLIKKGVSSVSPFIGTKQLEVEFLMNKLSIEGISKLEDIDLQDKNIVLVDASDIRGLDDRINPISVKYVIDHRKHYDKEAFPNAQFNVQLVGSAATLITEMYINENMNISLEAATLLYYAIVSNTINFKANVTHKRDHIAFNWLAQHGAITTLQHEIFDYKTENVEITKKSIIENYIAIPKIQGIDVLVIQFEIANVSTFIQAHKIKLISILDDLISEFELMFGFYTFVDIEIGKNYFLTNNINSQELLKKSLSVSFKNDESNRDGILMRKEIIPKLKVKADNMR